MKGRLLATSGAILWIGLTAAATSRAPVLIEHLRYLSSDALKGRGNSQPELSQAADYIAQKFSEYGLLPAGEDGGYFQTFEIRTQFRVGEKSQIRLRDRSGMTTVQMGQDFAPVGYGPLPAGDTEVVFAGFGISAPEYNYDDYEGVDVQGKAVLIYDHEPEEFSERSRFEGMDLTPYSTVAVKLKTARDRGAVAVILIPDWFNHTATGRPAPALRQSSDLHDLGIPAIRVSRALGEAVIRGGGGNPAEVRRWINRHLTPHSFWLPDTTVSLDLEIEATMTRVRNVAGLIPGETNEILIIGAHYDHLGLGGPGSLETGGLESVHNGADDNASGVAGILQLASDLGGRRPRRSLLLLAFAGEEIGLLGSRFYVENPLFPLDQTVAMLNLDMIGRSTGQLLIGGVGTAEEFRTILEQIQPVHSIEFVLAETPRGSSDHLPFAQKGIPVLFFFSGLHADYHRASDDFLRINIPATLEIVSVVGAVWERLDAAPARPRPTPLPTEMPPLQSPDSPGRRAPLFGSFADLNFEGTGVRFSGILEGSPAERAGLRAGDLLVEFDGKKIENLYDFTLMLRQKTPGSSVSVVVIRDGRRIASRLELGRERN